MVDEAMRRENAALQADADEQGREREAAAAAAEDDRASTEVGSRGWVVCKMTPSQTSNNHMHMKQK